MCFPTVASEDCTLLRIVLSSLRRLPLGKPDPSSCDFHGFGITRSRDTCAGRTRSIMRMTVHLGPPKGMVNYKNAIM